MTFIIWSNRKWWNSKCSY